MTQPNQDQAVREWMESLGFEYDERQSLWWKDGRLLWPEQALFFYTICQKAEREGRVQGANSVVNVAGEGYFICERLPNRDLIYTPVREWDGEYTPLQDTVKQREESDGRRKD